MIKKQNEDLGVSVNIHTFLLRENVSKYYLNKVRKYVKTGNQNIYNRLVQKGVIQEYKAVHNLVTTVGRNVLARRLAGNTTYTGEVNYGALGTAVSPVPANNSTQLGTEVFRKVKASASYDNNIAYVDFFYTASDTNGTYTEFGSFIDGSGTANSGRLFSYIATGGWTKSSSQSLFISCVYTLT